jgi:hypothetical protein
MNIFRPYLRSMLRPGVFLWALGLFPVAIFYPFARVGTDVLSATRLLDGGFDDTELKGAFWQCTVYVGIAAGAVCRVASRHVGVGAGAWMLPGAAARLGAMVAVSAALLLAAVAIVLSPLRWSTPSRYNHLSEPPTPQKNEPGISIPGSNIFGVCRARRHWNSPSYRTAAGNFPCPST